MIAVTKLCVSWHIQITFILQPSSYVFLVHRSKYKLCVFSRTHHIKWLPMVIAPSITPVLQKQGWSELRYPSPWLSMWRFICWSGLSWWNPWCVEKLKNGVDDGYMFFFLSGKYIVRDFWESSGQAVKAVPIFSLTRETLLWLDSGMEKVKSC
jgi:hypothetical protein